MKSSKKLKTYLRRMKKIMSKIKRFIDCYVPTETCNLRCHYCYIAQKRKFNNKIASFNYSSDYIRKALSVERLGGICLFNICAGGETLISDEVIDVIKELLEEGHYVTIVTNGTLTKKFKMIAEFPKELLKRLIFKFSFHYLELIRLNLLDTFFENVILMRNSGASITVEITPSDELEPYIDEIKEISISKLGALPHITIARLDKDNIPILTKHTKDDYVKTWQEFESSLFEFKMSVFGEKRREFCYAGDWSVYLNLVTGDVYQCYSTMKIDNIYDNIDRPIHFKAIGCNCRQPHCYNAHGFLALGDIPNLDTPTYASLRNRVCVDGTEWLNEDAKEIMNSKLNELNQEYSAYKKIMINSYNKYMITKLKIINKIKKVLK